MVPAGMPELRETSDIADYMLDVFQLNDSDDVAGDVFMKEVEKALVSRTRYVDTLAHMAKHA
jgi:hypothetical protein